MGVTIPAQLRAIADQVEAGGAAQTVAAFIEWPAPNEVITRGASFTPVDVRWRGVVDIVRITGAANLEAVDGRFSLAPGWYRLALIVAGQEVHAISFGVGDVYVVAGQSNAVSPLQPATHVLPTVQPGRVIVSQYYGPSTASTHQYQFRDVGVSPLAGDAQAGAAWVACGHALNRPHPVAFVIVARGNTSTADWVNVHIGDLFTAWARYRPRAVLWHQGESDCTTPARSDSFVNLNACVQSLRQVTITPWVMALNSTSNPAPAGGWPIRSAQQQVIDAWPHVHLGPDTDTIRKPGQVEFTGADLNAHGVLWSQRLVALGL